MSNDNENVTTPPPPPPPRDRKPSGPFTPDPPTNLIGRIVGRGYSIIAARPVITLAIVSALAFLVIFAPGFILGVKDAFSSKKIEKAKDQAATEKTATEHEKIAAGELETERKAEDDKRTEQIEPQRQRAATRLDEARRRRETLERNYEKDLQTPRRPPTDDGDLRRRNCSDLAGIFHGQRVAGCQ